MCSALDIILASPGLQFIFADILLQLDFDSFETAAKKTSHLWTQVVIENQLWKRRLFRLAPSGTYLRNQLEERSYEFQRVLKGNLSLDESSEICHKLCLYLLKGLKKDWMTETFEIYKVPNARIVRDLVVMEENIAFAVGNSINIAKRADIWKMSKRKEKNFCLPVHLSLNSHRREINCLDIKDNLLMAGGRDRTLTIWNINTGKLNVLVSEAHSRLITCVRLKEDFAYSSSRDRTVKIWQLRNGCSEAIVVQTLEGHAHSIWTLDTISDFLVFGSTDKHMSIWKKNSDVVWKHQSKVCIHSTGIRNLRCLKIHPGFLLSGDLYGELKVFNLHESKLCYEVPEQEGSNWFRHSGNVVSISECVETEAVAVAFGNHSIILYDTASVQTRLPVMRRISLDEVVEPGLLRCIVATPSQLYICNFSGSDGIVVLDIWKLG